MPPKGQAKMTDSTPQAPSDKLAGISIYLLAFVIILCIRHTFLGSTLQPLLSTVTTKKRKFNSATNTYLSLLSTKPFPPFKLCQCSFLIKRDLLNPAFKDLHPSAPCRLPVIPVLWHCCSGPFFPTPPTTHTLCLPTTHIHPTPTDDSDASLAPAIDKFHIWLLLTAEMTLLIRTCLRKSIFR